MCNCGNTITTSSVCSSCVPNDCACPIKDLSTDCIKYTGEDLPCTEILGGTLMTEAFSQLDTYLCDLSTQLANSFSLISVGEGTRVYKGVDGIGRKEIRSITPTNAILTVGLSTDDKEIEIGVDTTVLGQFVQANQITYSISNVGTGANVYKSSTQAGNNVTFNLRDIKSTDSRVTVTEGPTDIDITLSANLAEATGTVNYVSKFTGTHTLGNSQIFDNGTNVGIGTSIPGSKFNVDANSNSAEGIVSRNLNTGGSAYSFVGAFSNTGEGGIDLRSNPSTHSSWPSTSWLNSSSEKTNGLIVNQAGANPIRFFTNGSEKVRITPSGFVGIGTPIPAKILDVNGDILVNGLTVGIGSNDITNAALGFEALQSSSGIGHNVAVGYRAAMFNTTGNSNMALGYASLQWNTTGDNNHAIGNGALIYQASSNSVGNGFLALAGVNGQYNTAMGTVAAWGDGNGFPLAPPVGTGYGNTAIGAGAIYSLANGHDNTAVGNGALAELTNGELNVGIGSAAGGQGVATYGNTAVGTGAMYPNVTGHRNTVVGLEASSTNFNESVVLGAFAQATGDNQFVIGSPSAPVGEVVTESNTSTKVWNVVINGVAYKILLA
jgi:trimeric autotransporter adhesin